MIQKKKYILPYRNNVAFVIDIVSLIFIIYAYYNMLSNYTGSMTSDIMGLMHIAQLIILFCALWTSLIAKENNHGALYWFFISALIGPIGLILISVKDRNISDPRVLSLILEKRNEFNIKLKSMPNSKEQLLDDYEKELEVEISKIPFAFRSGFVQETPLVEYNSEWTEDESKCPACGFHADENTKYCSSCGLRLR